MKELLFIAGGALALKYFFNIDITGGMFGAIGVPTVPTNTVNPSGTKPGAGDGNSSTPGTQGGATPVTPPAPPVNTSSLATILAQVASKEGSSFSYHQWAFLCRAYGFNGNIPAPEDVGAGDGTQALTAQQFLGYMASAGLGYYSEPWQLGTAFIRAESMAAFTAPTRPNPMERLTITRRPS